MTTTKRCPVVLGALTLLMAVACSRDALLNDTGYKGTWSRGNDRVTSTIALYPWEGGWKIRWRKTSKDGKFGVRCDWDGNCVETLDGEKQAEMKFSTWVDAASGHVFVACDETRFVPERLELRYVDELVVEGGGLILRAKTRERAGQRMDGGATPTRTFDKIADAVAFPPGTRFRE